MSKQQRFDTMMMMMKLQVSHHQRTAPQAHETSEEDCTEFYATTGVITGGFFIYSSRVCKNI